MLLEPKLRSILTPIIELLSTFTALLVSHHITSHTTHYNFSYRVEGKEEAVAEKLPHRLLYGCEVGYFDVVVDGP